MTDQDKLAVHRVLLDRLHDCDFPEAAAVVKRAAARQRRLRFLRAGKRWSKCNLCVSVDALTAMSMSEDAAPQLIGAKTHVASCTEHCCEVIFVNIACGNPLVPWIAALSRYVGRETDSSTDLSARCLLRCLLGLALSQLFAGGWYRSGLCLQVSQ